MSRFERFTAITRVKGVSQYILVDCNGIVAAHHSDDPKALAALVWACGRNASCLGKAGFRHLICTRKNQENIFIFPVGNHYLGVVKKKNIENAELAGHIEHFLKDLLSEQ
jgi:hypothetical protein